MSPITSSPKNIPIDHPRPNTTEPATAKHTQTSKISKSPRLRTPRACTYCRLRKSKCDGGKPCARCIEDDEVCQYTKAVRKETKEYSQSYVERLLEQNGMYKTAMRLLYVKRRLSALDESGVMGDEKVPLTHEILASLGLLSRDETNVESPQHVTALSPEESKDDTFTQLPLSHHYSSPSLSTHGNSSQQQHSPSLSTCNTSLRQASQSIEGELMKSPDFSALEPDAMMLASYNPGTDFDLPEDWFLGCGDTSPEIDSFGVREESLPSGTIAQEWSGW